MKKAKTLRGADVAQWIGLESMKAKPCSKLLAAAIVALGVWHFYPHCLFCCPVRGAVVAQWIRPRTLNCEVPGSNLLAVAGDPLGKALYPHW